MNLRKRNGLAMICMMLLVLCALIPALGESYGADIMRLLRYDGSVEILDVTGNSRFVMENVRFSSGETMRTGAAASASVSLDDTKIVSLDENSSVKFEKDGQHMKLTLTEGTLFLDVAEKLNENQSLDIQTSNMTVGIRGTIVYLTTLPSTAAMEETSSQNGAAGQTTVLGVLEGSATLSYHGAEGAKTLTVDAGKKAIISDQPAKEQPSAVVQEIAQEDLTQFVAGQIGKNENVRNRVEEACPQLLDEYLYTADGDWEFTSKVTLIAQSASKLYDGNPLTRTGDILVYGLPEEFGISAYAGGSRTDAGTSDNPIASYRINNKFGDDITRHFTAIETVSGNLVVDPAPMTIWTGSATKAYDGVPLTNAEAGFDLVSGQTREEPWRNTSLALSESEGETLYGISGKTLVHGTNPLTEETREDLLPVGYKLTIHLSDEKNSDTIAFQIEKIGEDELPEEILRLYADNPELLSQACEDAGWDEERILERISQLPPAEEATTEKDGLTVSVSMAGGLRRQLTNARINIDTEITEYNGRALSGEEAHFADIRIDDSVKVTATGSQTEVGESQNTYEIDWGTENLNNFIISEDLGTLRVLESFGGVTITAASAQKVYDGAPLSVADAIVAGLPSGYSVEAVAAGELTDAGSVPTEIQSYKVFDPNGEDVTEFYPNIRMKEGTLTIDPAPLTIRTGSAEKVFDGQPLAEAGATLSGLVNGETATAVATGTLTDAGSADNGYEIRWDSAKAENYAVTEELGTLTVEPLSLTIDGGSASADYTGSLYVPSPVVSYGNGAHAGETVPGTRLRSMEIVYRYSLFTGDSLELTITGSGVDAGSYTLAAKASLSGSASNYALPGETIEMPLEIEPASLTVATGSASKAFDGQPLTNTEATVTGLQGGDSVTVTAIGEQQDVGSSENGYAIDWGEVKPANYALTEALGTLEVTANTDKITFTAASASKIYDGTALTDNSATATGLPTGFAYEATVVGSQTEVGTSDNVVTAYKILGVDNIDVTANFTGITTEKGTLEVTPVQATVTTSSASKIYDATPLTGTATIAGLLDEDEGKVTVTATGTITDFGSVENTYTIDWNGVNPENYAITEELGTLSIEPITLTVDLGDASCIFDHEYHAGSPFIASSNTGASVKQLGASSFQIDFTEGFTSIGYNVKGGGRAAGSYTITCESVYDGGAGVLDNYSVSFIDGKQTIVPAKLLIDLNGPAYDRVFGNEASPVDFLLPVFGNGAQAGDSVTTQGIAHLSGETWQQQFGAIWGDSFVVKLSGWNSNGSVGTHNLTASVEFVDSEDAGNYEIAVSNMSYTVSPAPVTITTGSASKTYDGTPLTSGEVTHTAFALNPRAVYTEADMPVITATGSQTEVGSSQNGYTIAWNGLHPEDYIITDALGTLEVKGNDTLITITSGDGYMRYKPYDCIVKNGEYTVEGLPAGFTLNAEITGEQSWEVGSSPNTIASYTILNAENKDVTAAFGNVKKVEGTLTIDKAIVTVWSDDNSKTYDGTPLQGGTIHWTGIYGTDNAQNGISIYHNTSLTDVGSAPDAFTVYWNYPELESLYEVSQNPGTLTVNPAGLKIATSSASKPFDGTPLTSASVTVTGLAAADESKVTVTATGTITEIGTTPNTYSIDWGGAKSANYSLTEELGTLEITPAELVGADLTIEIPDGSGIYSGQAQGFSGSGVTVTFADSTLTPDTSEGVIGNYTYQYTLPNGDAFTLTVQGGGLNVGEYPVTGSVSFTTGSASGHNITLSNGTYTVKPLGLSIDLGGGGSAVYSGEIAGEPGGFTVKYTNGPHAGETVESDGGAIDQGSVTRTYTLFTNDSFSLRADMPTDVGTHALSSGAKFSPAGSESNYSISYSGNSFTVEPLRIGIQLIGAEIGYNGTPQTPGITVKYLNGPSAGSNLADMEYMMNDDYSMTVYCPLCGSDRLTITVPASGADIGSYNLSPSYAITGKASNYSVSTSGCTITITPEPYST